MGNYTFAVQMKFRELKPDVGEKIQEQPATATEDCSWISVHYTTPGNGINIPEKCSHYTFVKPPVTECDSKTFPMNCRFKLRKAEKENLRTKKNLLNTTCWHSFCYHCDTCWSGWIPYHCNCGWRW